MAKEELQKREDFNASFSIELPGYLKINIFYLAR